jgi:hypothetical protein
MGDTLEYSPFWNFRLVGWGNCPLLIMIEKGRKVGFDEI